MLGSLHPFQKTNWKKCLSPMVQVYNSTMHESTGQSPNYLMFGREPLLPIDIAFGINNILYKVHWRPEIKDENSLNLAREEANNPIMRKRDPFQIQDQRHNRMKEKRDKFRSTEWDRSIWVKWFRVWNSIGCTGTEKNSHRGFQRTNCKRRGNSARKG